MLLIRFLLIGVASLVSAWALSICLGNYLLLLTQSFDPLSRSTLDAASAIVWLVVALSSGLFAFGLLRSSYKERRRVANAATAPARANHDADLA